MSTIAGATACAIRVALAGPSTGTAPTEVRSGATVPVPDTRPPIALAPATRPSTSTRAAATIHPPRRRREGAVVAFQPRPALGGGGGMPAPKPGHGSGERGSLCSGSSGDQGESDISLTFPSTGRRPSIILCADHASWIPHRAESRLRVRRAFAPIRPGCRSRERNPSSRTRGDRTLGTPEVEDGGQIDRGLEPGRGSVRRRDETGEESSAEERRLEDALRAATHQVDVALSSLGDTLRDPEAKQTLREAIRALGDALSVTFSEVGEQIRTHLGTGGPPKPPGS